MQPVRWLSCIAAACFYRVAYRTRAWGSLPRKRPASLLVANHQHEIESAIIVGDQTIRSLSWRRPINTVSSRRMWEPGFFAERIPWLRPFFRTVNLGWFFAGIGLQPIENELHTRPFVSIAYTLVRSHGDLPAAQVFRERVLARIPNVASVRDLLASANFDTARGTVSLSEINEPYRGELLAQTRTQLEADIANFEHIVRNGGTVFLTPEGFYTTDGKMQRFRGILSRLAPMAKIYAVGVSYDPFIEGRFTLLYRVQEADPAIPLETTIKRIRPVTVSALLATFLKHCKTAFSQDEAVAMVRKHLSELPAHLFVDPKLTRDPARMTRSALAGMTKLQILDRFDDRYALTERRRHPQFPNTDDIVEYQANFHAETLS
ncbi:MAG TPA: hypothetical protein VMB20_09430 [Candidatus Acidoferrum sp.]|nr:hypothetical protein [Candidatus Acidoferrum sp.]